MAAELTPETEEMLRSEKKLVSGVILKKYSNRPWVGRRREPAPLARGEIQTAEKFPKKQIAAMIGMACFADGIKAHINDFLKQADTFARLASRPTRMGTFAIFG